MLFTCVVCLCCNQPVLSAVLDVVLIASFPLLMPTGPTAEAGSVFLCCTRCVLAVNTAVETSV